MKIKIFPPPFCKFDCIDERGWMEMDEGAMLSDALRLIAMPRALAKLMQVKLNGLKEPLNTKLKDGDVIGFFAFISGG